MPKYKVTRTWYLEADSCCDAIEKSKSKDHQDVRARRLDILTKLFETKGANE